MDKDHKIVDSNVAFIRAARDFHNVGRDGFKPGYDQYGDLLDAAEALICPAPDSEKLREAGETWDSIAAWCEATFGPCTASRIVSRAAEEMVELRDETLIAREWSHKARIEVADVLICLSRVPGIWAAVEEKMAINRARKWNVKGDGTGYHIPQNLGASS